MLPLTSEWRVPLVFSKWLREAESDLTQNRALGVPRTKMCREGAWVAGEGGSCLRPIYLSKLPGSAPGSTAAGAAAVEGD